MIHPLGFKLENRALRRAGFDYHEWADVQQYSSFDAFIKEITPERLFAFSTKGRKLYTDVSYKSGDVLLFGPETRGLPDKILNAAGDEHVLRLPMKEGSRSLNLSNTVAVIVYQAWSQLGFAESN